MHCAHQIGRVVLSMVLLAAAFLSGCDKQASDRAAIKRVFDDLDAANNNSDGEAAASVLTSNTFAHYGRLVKVGLDGTRAEVMALPPVSMLEVFTMRSRASRKDLKGLDGRGYVIFATSHGWYSDWESSRVRIVNIKIDGLNATAEVMEGTEKSDMTAKFVNESGAWKFDETSIYEFVNKIYRQDAKSERMKIEEYLLSIASMHADEDQISKVWSPMR